MHDWIFQWYPRIKKTFTYPNKNPAPRGLSLYPVISSGSLHNKSEPKPFYGIYWTLGNSLILSIVSAEGDKPPCIQNIWFYTNAVKGR